MERIGLLLDHQIRRRLPDVVKRREGGETDEEVLRLLLGAGAEAQAGVGDEIRINMYTYYL